MSDSPPFEVLMKGPAAVAAWLADEAGAHKRRRDTLINHQLAVMATLGLDPRKPNANFTGENLSLALGACAQVAALIIYCAKNGMRGPARDALSETIDICFDVIDEAEEGHPMMAEIMRAMRATK